MPIVSPHISNPLIDGRQSEKAMLVRRGVQKLLAEMGYSVLPELTLANGRRADLIALTPKGAFWIIEIKSSIADFQIDKKWPEYRAFCDHLFFATHAEVPAEIFPAECGLLLADGYGAEIIRSAPEHKLVSATRKALLQRFARSAANRLLAVELAGVVIPGIADID